jgi:hypothetical protein
MSYEFMLSVTATVLGVIVGLCIVLVMFKVAV